VNVVGKSSKSKAGAAADTVVSPSPPSYGPEELPTAIDPVIRPELGARSGERMITGTSRAPREGCLAHHEVVPYLGRGCPRELRARVEGHVAGCSACGRWVRHIGDEVLEYIGGQLSEDELARMDAHLDACSACRDLVHHVVQGMAQSFHGEGHDASDPGTTFLPGNVVNGRYMVLRFVGRGGMGEVYEAFDQLMDRRIALKTVLCTVADRPRAARRFKEEVRNAQRVGHRHVCRINDLQEHHEAIFGPSLPFFTMEFIEGDRLGNRLAEGPLPVDDARVIALQLLGGLEAAHARGVLHLDFKSDNVMLRRDSEPPEAVIMDFGLSRVLGKESRLRTSDRRQFAGTLPYMSVEQLECRDVLGPATDVYAFGVVLYEMLTRALPFDGESLGAVLLKQLKERPRPPSHHVRELSPALDHFVLKCLHSNPRQRYADAGAALLALQALRSWTRPPLAARLQQTLPWVAGAIGIAIVALSSIPRASPPAPGGEAPAGPAEARAPEPGPPPSAPDGTSPPLLPAQAAMPVSSTLASSTLASSTLASSTPPLEAARPTLPAAASRAARRSPRPSHSGASSAPVQPSLPAAGGLPAATPVAEGAITDTAPVSLSSAAASPAAAALAGAAPAPRAEAVQQAPWRPTRVPKRLSSGQNSRR
jgi:serine/threonine protein kinase